MTSPLPSDSPDVVVLVDETGQVRGTADRLQVHTDHTPLHLAFSSYLFDPAGRLLITRRALGKKTWPGVWTNSCCGHLRPGEDAVQAATRRIAEELGVPATGLRVVLPDFRYRAVDSGGIVENELCPVLVGHIGEAIKPDPAEIAEHRFVEWDAFRAAVGATPAVFSPWAVAQASELSDGHPLAATVATDSAGFLAAVDAELAACFDQLEAEWLELAGPNSLDVLPADLPAWARRLSRAGGKRIRVAMVWWGFVTGGGRRRPTGFADAVRAATALELLHLFALIHDDVMDASPLRRGLPAAHVEASSWHADAGAHGAPDQFGLSMAILLGDLVHTLADRMADQLPAPMRSLWYELCVELIAGQRADLTASAARRRELALARQVADRKSGAYSISRPLLLGAAAAHASRECEDTLARFGSHLGLAFALRDDDLGVWGEPAQTGKPAGDDLVTAKPTVIAALASQRMTPESLRRWDAVIDGDAAPERVAAVQQELITTGVRAELESMIQAEADAALAELDSPSINPEAAAGLGAAVTAIAWRTA